MAPQPRAAAELAFYRERDRFEIDLLVERGERLTLIEVKAGCTPSGDYFKAFPHFTELIEARGDGRWRVTRRAVVYGGEEAQMRSAGEPASWSELPNVDFD